MFVSSFVKQRDYTAHELYALCGDVTRANGRLQLAATGHSMRPLLPHGTIVVLGPVFQPLPVGAIVLALLGEQVVLHRVLWRWHGRVLLAGDANARRDGWVDMAQLAGMVIEWHTSTHHVHVASWRRKLDWALALARHMGRWLLGQRK